MISFDKIDWLDWLKDAILPIITFLLGVIYSRIRKWFDIARQQTRFEYAKSFKSPYDAAWIVDSAVPSFDLDRNSIIDTGKVLLLSIPDEARNLLLRKPEKGEETEFYHGPDQLLGFEDWDEIEQLTGIPDLLERVDKYRRSVASDALEGKNGFHFNSKKIGIRNIDLRRRGDEETSYLSISSYITDYFTHRVMQGVIREWTQEDCSVLPSLRDNEEEIFKRYYMFCTSLGLNAFVLTQYRKELVLVERSKKTADGTSSGGKIHVTMNEGFSSIDFDHGRVGRGFLTVDNCFRRGMAEELGISPTTRLLTPIHIYDIFFVPDLFQFGLFGWAIYEGDWFDLKFERAQDRPLEVRDVRKYDFDHETIHELIEKDAMIPYAAVGVEQLSRIFGVITPELSSVGAQYYFTLSKYLYRGLFRRRKTGSDA